MEPATLKLKSFSKKCALLYPNKYSYAILEPTEKEKKIFFNLCHYDTNTIRPPPRKRNAKGKMVV